MTKVFQRKKKIKEALQQAILEPPFVAYVSRVLSDAVKVYHNFFWKRIWHP